MKRIRFISYMISVSLLTGFVACKSTQKISSWTVPEVPSGIMQNTIVLGIIEDETDRSYMENLMVQALKNNGIHAATSAGMFGTDGWDELKEEEIAARLNDYNITAVMFISLLDKEKERNYYPGSFYSLQRDGGMHRYYRRYVAADDKAYFPGYSSGYVLEAEVYSIKTDALMYSAHSVIKKPNENDVVATKFADAIIKDMKEKRIIP